MKLVILYEGQHELVVQKPANMLVVKGRGHHGPTLLDEVQKQFGKSIRPVHRLDRVTTGCCLFAKSLYGQQALMEAFRKRLIQKRYLAIVEGVPHFKRLAIDARLERQDFQNTKKGPMAKQSISDQGKQALTRIGVLAKGTHAALVEALPQMGRMHQIRAHLWHVGFPIIGDKLYHATLPYEPHAIALHAQSLIYPAPTGGKITVTAPLPKRFLAELKTQGIEFTPQN